MKNFFRRSWLSIVAVLIAAALPAMAVVFALGHVHFTPQANAAPAQNPEESKKLFEKMATVMLYPRCINCHTVEDFPAQTDAHTRHANDIVRSASQRGTGGVGVGAGAGAVPCISCHAASNQGDGRQPGALGWRMPPASMGWDKMKTAGELCRHVTDPNFNGGRDAAALVEHMTTDPLVNYAFDPGTGRSKPPLTADEFHETLKKWAETGAFCPDK